MLPPGRWWPAAPAAAAGDARLPGEARGQGAVPQGAGGEEHRSAQHTSAPTLS